jgi:hypothetical protein
VVVLVGVVEDGGAVVVVVDVGGEVVVLVGVVEDGGVVVVVVYVLD